jgi:flagellar hook-basal body complex protein FliE
MIFRADQVNGQIVDLRRTNPLHFDGMVNNQQASKDPEKSFGKVFMKAFDDVNDSLNQTDDLTKKMITDPDQVSVHDVMISMAESSLALNMAKTVVNRAIQAYRDLINVR